MNTCFKKIPLALAMLFAAIHSASAQVSLSVVPAVVSNTYSGVITFQIGGLTNGEQVIVQSWLDVNSNLVVDAGEPLLNAFSIKEGGANIINGVTNVSVPFDSNPATNAITTTLNFAATLDNLVGQRIFRVVSPTSRFTPANFIFDVTNSTFAQSVSGNVFVNGTTPVSHALVVALQMPSQNYTAATLADNSGHYSLPLSPGTYGLVALAPNTYIDQSLAPLVTLTPGNSLATNVFLTAGTVALSGTVFDSSTSNTLGGVFLQLEEQNGNLFAVAFTDTNGNFSTMVTNAVWKIKGESSILSRNGYVVLTQGGQTKANTTGGSVTNAIVTFTQGNALFFGSALSPTSTPLVNFHINATTDGSSPNAFKSDVFTDQNGNYGAAVLVTDSNLSSTNAWNCNPGENPAFSSLIVTSGFHNTLVTNQAVQANFTSFAGNATISGRLHDPSGNPISGINISGSTEIGSTFFSPLGAATDANGHYSIAALSAHTWTVFADCCDDSGLENQSFYDPLTHIVSVASASALVDITAFPDSVPVLSSGQRFSSSNFSFQLNTPPNPPGNNYTILATTNVTLPFNSWSNVLTTNINGGGFSTFISDNHATNSPRFYSVKVSP